MLWQAYLHRKAFPFAADTATDALVSNVRMCYVPHDAGPEENSDEDWDLEDEPIPGAVDSWARMHLDVRRKRDLDDNLPKVQRSDRRFQSQRARSSGANQRRKGDKSDETKPREKTFDLREEVQLDEEEEKLRDARQQEEAKRRERENKVRANEKAEVAEQQRVQALHEEMAKKPHTFDSDGGLIWVEDIRYDRLPKTQEVFGWTVKKDPKAKGTDLDGSASLKKTDSPAQKKQQQSRGRKTRFGDSRSKLQKEEDDFPDGFSKLQHGQPPIHETMNVKPGVVLVSHGKPKVGPPVAYTGGGMSRKEYVALTEKEMAFESQFASMSDPSATSPRAGDRPGSPKANGGATGPAANRGSTRSGSAGGLGVASLNATADPQASETQLESTLPPISTNTDRGLGNVSGGPRKTAAGNRSGSAGMGSTGSLAKGEGESTRQTAPTAPSHFARAKKMEAIGHLERPPRLHVAPLGGPHGYGVAQPPLGATMGHGLHRHQSTKEAYFFPDSKSQMLPLLRSSSEASLVSKKRPLSLPSSKNASREDSRAQTAPYASIMEDEDSPSHGLMHADTKSSAYRNMRQALFPNSLNSNYVSGM
jgi:hypothetical protein